MAEDVTPEEELPRLGHRREPRTLPEDLRNDEQTVKRLLEACKQSHFVLTLFKKLFSKPMQMYL